MDRGQSSVLGRSAFWMLLLFSILISISLATAEVQNATALAIAAKKQKNLKFEAAHGWLLWVSTGFLLPLGTIVIRMSKLATENGASARKLSALFYTHVALQVLGVGLSVIGGGISLKFFGNKFRHTHHRLGLALYALIWLLPFTGFLRPKRGTPTRSIWYFVHWLLGNGAIVLGFINSYIGLTIYEKHAAKSMRTWNVLFSIQIAIMAAIYLLQDRWTYMKEQSTLSKPMAPPPKLVDSKQVSALPSYSPN